LLSPVQWKLALAEHGVRLAPEVEKSLVSIPADAAQGPITQGIELVLPHGVVAEATTVATQVAASPLLLTSYNDGLILVNEREPDGDVGSVAVSVVAAPRFYDETTRSGRPMRQVAMMRGGALSISPFAVCGFAEHQAPCLLCPLHSSGSPGENGTASIDEVLEVVGAAFAEGATEMVFFNTGWSPSEDGGFAALEPYIEAVKKHFDTLVALRGHPPSDDQWIDRTYAAGVDALGYGIEIFDPECLSKHCPERSAMVTRDRYLSALQYAAQIFPNGTVWTDLIVGLEPIASTRTAIDTLTDMGVVPVLCSAPRMVPSAPAAPDGLEHYDGEDERSLYAHLYRAVRDSRINALWMRDLGYGVTPIEARFFAGEDATLDVAASSFYRSRLGSRAVRSLSRLRRRLRVRRVSESFDAAHL
jgi:hypothetical protein